MQLRGDKPHVIGPLCAAVQMLNVSRAGEEPDMATAEEDCRLLFGPEAMEGASHRAGAGSCAALCCAVLCCAVLCCAVLCCAVLCCAVLCCRAVLSSQPNATLNCPPPQRRPCRPPSAAPTLSAPPTGSG